MLTWRMVVLFVHVTAVIVALGGSLFSTFALAPILTDELEPQLRLRVMRRIIRRLGTIILSALAILVFTGFFNVLFIGMVSALLVIKLLLVLLVIGLAIHQYADVGAQIWQLSSNGPRPEVGALLVRFRRIGLTVGTIVLLIVYLSLGLTRIGAGAMAISIR